MTTMRTTLRAVPPLPRPVRAGLTHVREVIPAAVARLCEDCDLPAADRDRLCRECRAEMDHEWEREVIT